MPMYNLLEYSDNYSMTLGGLWNHDENESNDAGDYKINNNKTTTSKSFEYKINIIGNTTDKNSRLDAKVVPLKYLSNFQGFLNLPLIRCKIELYLSWSKNCAISKTSRTPEVGGDNPVEPTKG